MRSFHRPVSAPLLLLVGSLSLLAAGCATGGGAVSMVATVSGGEKILVPVGAGGAAMTREGDVRIEAATFTLNAQKKFVYIFGFTVTAQRPLRHVRIEDVSDAAPVLLLEDAAPALSATGAWKGETGPLGTADPKIAWLATLPNTLRMTRFTVTFADGKTQVLHQGTLYPAAIKSAARQAMGENY